MPAHSGMRVTAIQFEVADGEPELNLVRARAMLQGAPAADVLLLPELFTTGYAYGSWEQAAARHTPRVVDEMEQLARDLRATIVFGAIAHDAEKRLVNRLWCVGNRQRAFYDKAHLIAAFREPELLTRGEQIRLATIAGSIVQLSICFDLRFPEFYRAGALAGAEVALVISAWPAVRTEALLLLARARAVENQCFVVVANRTGNAADGTTFEGRSHIVAPDGMVIASLGSDPGHCSADIDLTRVRELRKAFPVLAMARPGWSVTGD